jgi:hypothetical protein
VGYEEGWPSHGLVLDASLGVGELWVDNGVYATGGRTVAFELSGGVAVTRNLTLFAAVHGARIVLPVSTEAKTDALYLYGAGPGLEYHLPRPSIARPRGGLRRHLRPRRLRRVLRELPAVARLLARRAGGSGASRRREPPGSDPAPSYTVKGLSVVVSASFN